MSNPAVITLANADCKNDKFEYECCQNSLS